MALGALIGAYQEDDSGGLRALLPLAGRTLVEYQARCASAAGAAPVVVLVERVPIALNDAFERLRHEGITVFPVSDGNEAASRFEPSSLVLLVGDGIAPPVELLAQLADEVEPAVITVPDDDAHQPFERIDAESRWAGVAVVDGRTLGSTAAMLGDWDLQSTLLRRALQAGALRLPIAAAASEPLLVDSADGLADFERRLLVASRGARNDWASRFLLPIVEEFATERLMETKVRPDWLIWTALLLSVAGAFAFTRGWLEAGLALLVLSTPLDLVARRLATLRLRPLHPRAMSRRLLWPAAGLALLALGWWATRHISGWGALATAVTAAAFAEAARVERGTVEVPGRPWLFSRRNAILAAVPFALAGAWTVLLVALALYAAGSFFFLQHARHRVAEGAAGA
ncbi:MAG TPA: hypothetical protein VEC14_12545 [Reyranellaceae bacterium]|nr:hypothetical protein [Reyranellaceae bacterium]